MRVDPIRILLAMIFWSLLMICATCYYLWQWLNTPQVVTDTYRLFEIEQGESLYSVAHKLGDADLIRWGKIWVVYARLADLSSIKAGEYQLSAKESPLSLLARFQDGKVVQHKITLVEGLNFQQFLSSLHGHERVKKTVDFESSYDFLSEINKDLDHPEGWFFPDTYSFSSGDSDIEILTRAHRKMKRVLEEEWERKAEGLPYKNAYEALIMASVVEKETGAAFERGKIAGVFVRRLKKRMRLQTDPTVIYGMGESYHGNIRRSDLTRATPYNTYIIRGLPPTPIAMPGREAIHAALHPAKGSSLYFVAKGDGTHYFSDTLEEHTNAVRRFQKKRRADYRSSPKAN